MTAIMEAPFVRQKKLLNEYFEDSEESEGESWNNLVPDSEVEERENEESIGEFDDGFFIHKDDA